MSDNLSEEEMEKQYGHLKEPGEKITNVIQTQGGMTMIMMSREPQPYVPRETTTLQKTFNNGWTMDYECDDDVDSKRRLQEHLDELTGEIGWSTSNDLEEARKHWEGEYSSMYACLPIACGPICKGGYLSDTYDVYSHLETIFGKYADIGTSENMHDIDRAKMEAAFGRELTFEEAVSNVRTLMSAAGIIETNWGND